MWFTNAAIYQNHICKSKTPKTPAHSEEYTNATISNNRIRKSHLPRICISLIYDCVLIKYGSIAAFVNVK